MKISEYIRKEIQSSDNEVCKLQYRKQEIEKELSEAIGWKKAQESLLRNVLDGIWDKE